MSAVARVPAQARDDFDEIWHYIAQDDPNATTRFTNRMIEKFQRLAGSPGIGAQHPELGEGLRGTPFGNYLIVYRRESFGTQVIRVITGWRDISQVEFDQ